MTNQTATATGALTQTEIDEIVAIRAMPCSQLRALYLQLAGKPTISRNKPFLLRACLRMAGARSRAAAPALAAAPAQSPADRKQAQSAARMRDLSERIAARRASASPAPAPEVAPPAEPPAASAIVAPAEPVAPAVARAKVAKPAKAPARKPAAKRQAPAAKPRRAPAKERAPKPFAHHPLVGPVGTIYEREHKGTVHRFEVAADGWRWLNRPKTGTWKSISKLAKELTGSGWGGLVFLGIADRMAKRGKRGGN